VSIQQCHSELDLFHYKLECQISRFHCLWFLQRQTAKKSIDNSSYNLVKSFTTCSIQTEMVRRICFDFRMKTGSLNKMAADVTPSFLAGTVSVIGFCCIYILDQVSNTFFSFNTFPTLNSCSSEMDTMAFYVLQLWVARAC
jgi:hypothetical protein